VVTSDHELGQRLAFLQNAIGAVPSPMDATSCCAGSKRYRCACNATSRAPASWRVASKRRGGFAGSLPWAAEPPAAGLARAQMRGAGGMISLELEGGLEEARRFLQALQVFTLAESLGGVESLAEHPAIMTHASVPPDVRRKLGIGDSLVRLSVGLEHIEDLWTTWSARCVPRAAHEPSDPPLATRGILSIIGNTPLVRLESFDTGRCELYVKLESQNRVARSRTASPSP